MNSLDFLVLFVVVQIVVTVIGRGKYPKLTRHPYARTKHRRHRYERHFECTKYHERERERARRRREREREREREIKREREGESGREGEREGVEEENGRERER